MEINNIGTGSVSDFLDNINTNFNNISQEFHKKQNKILIMKKGDSVTNDQGEIIITINDEGIPTGGTSGDIVIVYENNQG